jgi:hypothetical protein
MIRAISYTSIPADLLRRGYVTMMDPKAWANAFKTSVSAFVRLKNNIKRDFFSSFLTVFLGLFAYAGFHVIATESVNEGLKRAFLMTNADRLEAARQASAEIMQRELQLAAVANETILVILRDTLTKAPSAARLRVAVFHNGIFTVTGAGILRFTVTHASAKPGRSSGPTTLGVPLSQMGDYLPALVRDECTWVRQADVSDLSAQARLREMNIALFLACPVVNAHKQILGGVFMSWDYGDAVPATPEDRKAAEAVLRASAPPIAVALDLRPSLTSKELPR